MHHINANGCNYIHNKNYSIKNKIIALQSQCVLENDNNQQRMSELVTSEKKRFFFFYVVGWNSQNGRFMGLVVST